MNFSCDSKLFLDFVNIFWNFMNSFSNSRPFCSTRTFFWTSLSFFWINEHYFWIHEHFMISWTYFKIHFKKLELIRNPGLFYGTKNKSRKEKQKRKTKWKNRAQPALCMSQPKRGCKWRRVHASSMELHCAPNRSTRLAHGHIKENGQVLSVGLVPD